MHWVDVENNFNVNHSTAIALVPFPSQSVLSTGIIPTPSDAIKPKETRNVQLLYTAKLHKCKIRLRKNIKTYTGMDLRWLISIWLSFLLICIAKTWKLRKMNTNYAERQLEQDIIMWLRTLYDDDLDIQILVNISWRFIPTYKSIVKEI